MHRPLARPLALLATMLLSLVAGTAPALVSAAPGDRMTVSDGRLDIGLAYLGSPAAFAIPGEDGTHAMTLAVPTGTSPATLSAVATLPPYVTGGTIDVEQNDRLLSRTPIPTAPNAPVTLPLTGVVVDQQHHSVDLTLRTRLRTDGFCTFTPDDGLRLRDAHVAFTGAPSAPRTVGDFLPPVAGKATLYVPADVRPDEGSAAVALAAGIVARYDSAPVRVETRSLPRNAMRPPAASAPLDRQIVVTETLPRGVSVVDGRYLTLGGRDLQGEADFLVSTLAPLAGSSAIPGPSVPAPQLPRQVSTLADIGLADQRVSTIGWPTLSIGIDQTRLGRPSKDIRVQLQGSYTPPATGSGGQVVVRSGDTVLASWPTDSSGTFDRWVDVPNRILQRYTELKITVERGDQRTGCGDAYRSTLALSSAGEIQSSTADPPLPAGFGSLPQALMPRTQLAWTRGDVADVARAVSVLTGLQRMSDVPLGVDLNAVDSLNRGLPAVVIAADGRGLPDLTLPVSGTRGGQIEVKGLDGRPAVTNVPAVPFGSLQVAEQDGQTVLVATSTEAPELLDDALAWLDDDPTRWTALSGSALLQAADSPPLLFTAPAPKPTPTGGSSAAMWAGIGIAVVIAVAAVGFGSWRWRRRRGTRSE